jgi:DNA invertase Pin-like site-specific DNA recombinase
MIYGYARVSTDGQSVEAQVAVITAAGAVTVYREVASGAKTDRAQLCQFARLTAGDVLLVTRLDRLARSMRDLLNTLAAITGTGAGFTTLGDTWADTTIPHGRLMLTVLGGLAEFECELIRARTSEGRARAKACGVRLGRRPKLTPYQQREALSRRANGEPLTTITRSYHVSLTAIARLAPPWQAPERAPPLLQAVYHWSACTLTRGSGWWCCSRVRELWLSMRCAHLYEAVGTLSHPL